MPYLIDGNNLLGSWGGPRAGEDRRGEVVRRVAAFCRARGARATVVFDGRPLRPEFDRQELGSVTVLAPEAGQDADTVILDLIRRAARPNELIVVSSDKALYSAARTHGAQVLRAHEWNALARGAAAARRRRTDDGDEKPDHEPDVEGWLERFERRDR
jgi:predicted RNA-binding protein with PIN domain